MYETGKAKLRFDGQLQFTSKLSPKSPKKGNKSRGVATFPCGKSVLIRTIWWDLIQQWAVDTPSKPFYRLWKPKAKPKAERKPNARVPNKRSVEVAKMTAKLAQDPGSIVNGARCAWGPAIVRSRIGARRPRL